MEEKKKEKPKIWGWVISSIIFRIFLIYISNNLNLGTRLELSTPFISFRRLAEVWWLKRSSILPYAGSMFHGCPLLLSFLGPLTVKRLEGQTSRLICSLVFVIADFVTAMLMRSIGINLQKSCYRSLRSLGLVGLLENSEMLSPGDISALAYLWNPYVIVTCVGLYTSVIKNTIIVLTLYGACMQRVPLAAFGWVFATHLSLYPIVLIIAVILLLGFASDTPPRKLFLQRDSSKSSDQNKESSNQLLRPVSLSWKPVVYFLLLVVSLLVLCSISLKDHGGLSKMHKRYN